MKSLKETKDGHSHNQEGSDFLYMEKENTNLGWTFRSDREAGGRKHALSQKADNNNEVGPGKSKKR